VVQKSAPEVRDAFSSRVSSASWVVMSGVMATPVVAGRRRSSTFG
jgi:hypothetical protein